MHMYIANVHHRALLTRSAHTLNTLQKEHRVRIAFPPRELAANPNNTQAREPSDKHGGFAPIDAVAITGRKECIDNCMEQLKDLVPISKTVDVPFDMHRALIGKGGAEIRQFQQVYDVDLKIPPADERLDEVTLSGARDAVESAADELLSRVKQYEAESYSMTIEVPVEYHARIIGPRGTQVELYRKKYNVHVAVPRQQQSDEQSNQTITIRGLQERAEECARDIEQMIANLQSMQRQDCHIDPRIHSRIIGQRGRGLQKIQEEHEVEIRFPRSDDPNPELVVVMGADMEKVLDAVDELKNLEEEYMQDHVERTRYEAPKVAKQPQTPKQAGLMMKNAPWALQQEDFPSVGPSSGTANGGPSGGMTGGGAWGRPR